MSCSDAVFRTLQSQVFGQEGPQASLSGTAPLMSTRLFLPGIPPPFLHTGSDQKLEPGMTYIPSIVGPG